MVPLSEECRDVPVVSVSLQDTLNNDSQNTARRSIRINQDSSRNRTSQQHSTSKTKSKSITKSSAKSSSKTSSKSPVSNRTPKRRNSKDTSILQNTGSPAQVSANQRRSTVDDYDCQNHSTPKKLKLETFGASKIAGEQNSLSENTMVESRSKKCHPKNKNMSTPKNNRSNRKTSKSPSTKLVHNMQSLNPLMNAQPMAELNLLSLPSELINMITNKLKPEDLKHYLLTHPQILEDVKETQFWKRKFEKQLTEAQKTIGGMTEYEKAIRQQHYVVGELYKNQYLKRAIAQVTLHRVIHRHHLEPTERSPKNPGIYGALKMIICKHTLYLLSYDKKLHAINLQNIVSTAHPHPRSAARLPQDFSTSTFLESQSVPNVHLNPSLEGLNRQVYHSNHSAHSSQSSQDIRDSPNNQINQQNNPTVSNSVQTGSSPETNPQHEKPWKVKDRFNAVVDATTDTRREPEKRRYLYVLSQSDELQDLGKVYNDKSSHKNKTIWNPEHIDYVEKDHILQQKTWDVNGFVMAGDRIDVYDEVDNGRRIFNMSFEITMRFTMIRLSKSEENTSGGTVPAPQVASSFGNHQSNNQNQNYQNYQNNQNHQNGPQNYPNQNPQTPSQNTTPTGTTNQPNPQEQKKRLLTVLSTSGRLFCLDVDEAHLGNLGDAGLQVTLSSLTNQEHGEIVQVNAGVSILTFINKVGHLYVSCQKKGDLQALFGKAEANRRIQENQDAGMAVHNAVRKAIRIFVPNVRVSEVVGENEMRDDGENGTNPDSSMGQDMEEMRQGMDHFRRNNENDDSEVTIEQDSVSDGDSDIPTTSTPQHALHQVTTPETPRTLQQIHSMNSHIQFTPSSDEQNSMDDDAEVTDRRFTENGNVGSESGNDEPAGENNVEDGGNTTLNTDSSDKEDDSGNNTDTEEDTTPRIIMSSVGDRHISFVDNHNRLFMMGKNQHGQLGTSDKIDKTMPTQVLQDKFVRFVTCGVNHTIACVEKRDAQDVITGVELYGCGCNQENRLPHPTFTSRDMPNNDQFRKLHVPGLPWNIRQLESVKGMLFSMANYSPEQLYENTFNNYKQRCIQDMQADNLKNMRVEELYIRTQALRCEPLNQPYNMNNQLTLISEMVSRLPRNDVTRVGEFLQNAVDSLQDNWLRQSFEEEGRFTSQRRPVRDYPPPRIAMRNRRENGPNTGNRVETGNPAESNGSNTNESSNSSNNVLEHASETENDDSMNESQTTMVED